MELAENSGRRTAFLCRSGFLFGQFHINVGDKAANTRRRSPKGGVVAAEDFR
jgi:hypothetical protein